MTSIQPGGSLIIAWQLKYKHVLVVGGGDVAAGRLQSVLATDATVSLIAPRDRLHPTVVALIKQFPQRVSYRDRAFKDADLDDASLVLTCIDDIDTSRRIVELCRARRVPVNAADIPNLCDFYFGSQIRQGPLQIMISTNGNGPKLANIIRRRIEATLPPHAGKAIENVGLLRAKLRQRAPGTGGELSKARMSWMSQVCESWSLDELALMDERIMERLLADGWELAADKKRVEASTTKPQLMA
ncbi:siroheme synthase [Exidia glandulosa HHB12029]|uniref:precorrin-2 dehydrogenase n=1 Tax=Exidia glandulosa HHB12029 TaxID=1314781 RepID=A0A165IYF2_EXIGL|nr:siroheme synthase [Exidia glandulosa HHB12029]